MTHAELLASGKNGVYRADLDEWYAEGEPQPPLKTTTNPEQLPAAAEIPEAVADDETPKKGKLKNV